MTTNNSTAGAINKLPQLSLELISDASTQDIYRAIRNHLPSLIPGIQPQDISTMSLGLSHSLSRHKLKFSPDKVDTMIVQAISLLDDLDKELNTYAMRVKEWYGWHFPEMGKIVNDNLAYARVILKMGMRSDASKADLAEILPEEIETAVRAAAEISMGTEITPMDLENITMLAEQVVSFTEYRSQLSSYLSARMQAIAPNLTTLVGELVGARLIAHAGSLMNLAKSPASTIQILGAEKALFRALKTKHDTPKYGLIYHSSLIGQATGKNKGKMARMLATKAALGLRVDALADWSADVDENEDDRAALSIFNREKLERRLASLEGKPLRAKGIAIGPNGTSFQPRKWEVKEARKYNHDADGLTGDEPAAVEPVSKKTKREHAKLIEEVSEEPASKKPRVDHSNGIKPIDEVVKDALNDNEVDSEDDEESDDGEDDAQEEPEAKPIKANASELNGASEEADEDGRSITLSTVSEDSLDSPASPTQQEINWQSPIEGNTKVAKKLRKKERHARKLILSEERSAKRARERARLARRLDRKTRRVKRAEQVERRDARADAELGKLAAKVGLSIVRYKRKLARGEIKIDANGKPTAISKKELKKAKKAAEKTGTAESYANGDVKEVKKRKREAEEPNGGVEKKKRKEKKEKGVKS